MSLPRLIVRTILLAVIGLGIGVVCAQDYPNRPVRIVVGQIASGNDVQARLIASGISGPLGQPVIVENRTSTTYPTLVAKALPDGYTLVVSGSVIWFEPLLRNYVPWDAVRDFSPITLMERSPNVLVVHPSVAARSVKELIALAKAKPEFLTYSRGSTGGTAHLGGNYSSLWQV
jgi:tripartite-type tricarboxylate transporter receptor subunit TctC